MDKTGDRLLGQAKKFLGMLQTAQAQQLRGGTMDPSNLGLLCDLSVKIHQQDQGAAAGGDVVLGAGLGDVR